jgi:prepilin-type N-terminal cleavage/methylation domain-containing protein
MINKKSFNQSGFTLIELLIVVSVIMIINLAVVEFFITGQETSQRGSQSLNRVGLARSSMSIISRDIRSATGIVPIFNRYKTNDSCLILKGKQTVIYTTDKNILQRIEYPAADNKVGLVFPLLKDVESIRFGFDTTNIEQTKLITVTISCCQMKFMDKNKYTITSISKLRVN